MNIYFLSKIYWGFGWLFRAWPRNSGFFYLVEILSNCASPGGFPSGSAIKNPPAMHEMQETWVRPLGQEDPLEEGMATHSSILAWRIPWTEEPGGSHGQENPMDREVHGVSKSRTQLSDWACTCFCNPHSAREVCTSIQGFHPEVTVVTSGHNLLARTIQMPLATPPVHICRELNCGKYNSSMYSEGEMRTGL